MLPFAEDNGLLLIFLLALGLAVVTLMLRGQRYMKRRRREEAADAANPAGGVHASPAAHPQNAPPELGQWEVQMHETARDLMGRLDSKMSALEALIAEADRAVGRLEAALSKTTEPPQPLDRQDEPPPASAAQAEPPDRGKVYMLADYGYDAAEIARRLGAPLGEIELILRLRGEGAERSGRSS